MAALWPLVAAVVAVIVVHHRDLGAGRVLGIKAQ
jgi:hypothetical protein